MRIGYKIKKIKVITILLISSIMLNFFSVEILANEENKQSNGKTVTSEKQSYYKTGWQLLGGKWYYVNEYGTKQTGWLLLDSTWYYFDNNGIMQTGWQLINGSWYYLNQSGAMQTGWENVDGLWYYLNISGEMQTGWVNIEGTWYYLNQSGAMQTEWQLVEGRWYYLNKSGAMQKEWQSINGHWYYLDKSGVMQTGWVKVNGMWYYLSNSGEMQTGWVKINGMWYYLSQSGEMQTEWINVNGIWYYLSQSGEMQIGWQAINGLWYYLDSSGAMQIGWKYIDGDWYYLNDNGAMKTGWLLDNGKWYYLYNSGRMATNTTIDGYIIGADGVWVEKTERFKKAESAARSYIDSKNVGVFCMDLTTGESFGINQDKIYPTASTAKLSAILYTQKRLNEGSLNLNTSYRYYDSVNNMIGAYQRGGTGRLQYELREGQSVTVEKMLRYTCSYSDNLGANLLAYHVSNQSDATFKNYIKTVLGREIINFTHNMSPKDLGLLMKEVYKEGGLALESLKNTSWDNVKIPKYIPVTVAHKIGIHSRANNDVAIVYTDRPYVISIMTPSLSDEFISQLSKKVYDELK